MKDRSIFTVAVALVSSVTLAASMSGAWLEVLTGKTSTI
jgi:hypothetical protein